MEFYVERVLHNAVKGTSDYKATKKFDNIDDAKKEYYNILATYINYGDLDRLCVILFDEMGVSIMHDAWVKEVVEEVPTEELTE